MWQNELTHLVSLRVYNVPGREGHKDGCHGAVYPPGRERQATCSHTPSEMTPHSPECREGSSGATWAENLEQQQATAGCQRRTQWP